MTTKFRISEIKRAITAMKEVKDFDDNALFGFTRDLRMNREDGIEVIFKQGDVWVTLDVKIHPETEEA